MAELMARYVWQKKLYPFGIFTTKPWCQVPALGGFNCEWLGKDFHHPFGCCDRYDYRKNLMDYDYQNFIKAWKRTSHANNGYMDVA